MLTCPSPGCSFSSSTKRGISVHRTTCKYRLPGIAREINKRSAQDDDLGSDIPQAQKRVRIQCPETLPEEQVAPLPSPPRSRSGRQIRVPRRLQDFIPLVQPEDEFPAHLQEAFPNVQAPGRSPSPQQYQSPTVEAEPEEEVFETSPCVFGTFRRYSVAPQRDPESHQTLESVSDHTFFPQGSSEHPEHLPVPPNISWLSRHADTGPPGGDKSDSQGETDNSLGPFDNASQLRLFDWHYNASLTKSKDDFDDLLDVLRSNGFSVSDLDGFSAQAGQEKLDHYVHPSGIFSAEDGWLTASLEIPLPKTRSGFASEEVAPHFEVGGMFYRQLTDLIRAVAEDTHFADQFHWVPHMYFWHPTPDASPSTGTGTMPPGSPHASPTPSPPPSPTTSHPHCQPVDSPPPTPFGSHSSPGSTLSLDEDTIRIFTDVYNSDAALQEFEAIRDRPRNPQDAPDVEYVMAPLLFWSDATHLTSFGSASLWPIYMYFGALSKYTRGMPTEFAAHHVAYIPSLPDGLQDYYMHVYGTAISNDILVFCKRELMQRVWLLLLDDDFLDAYENGILVKCGDGITRRIFPRILTYSADYPEKILLTALKPLSKHPCPRCLVSKDDLCLAGTPDDMHDRHDNQRTDTPALQRDIAKARKLIFKGAALGGKRVKSLLDGRSLNPVQSAFSARLSRFGLNHYQLFAPDLMHEFELGVWKNTFIHLLRLLVAQGGTTVQEFNRRMRNMPTFGRDTIRKFWHNVSARKQLAARDFEDFLACVMPAFEGLLPPADDEVIADMLFELAAWHALAKLRLHTTITITIMRATTTHMCRTMRAFARTTCKRYKARELPKETEARLRRDENGKRALDHTPKIVRYNVLNTYKYHSLPDYPAYIERGGTTDNYNSQVAELEHRHAKRFYRRTNKIGYALQIAKHQRRAALLRALRELDDYVPRRERLRIQTKQASQSRLNAERRVPQHECASDSSDEENLSLPAPPLERYAISQSSRAPLRLSRWLTQHQDDAAIKNFLPMLHAHVFGRLMDRQDYDEFTPDELDRVHVEGDRLYPHKVLRVNYTTYDMRRAQDVISPRTHPHLMVHADGAPETPYWYGRLINIFHAYVRYDGPGATPTTRRWQRLDFLWVRWFEEDPDYLSGFQDRRLPRLRFIDAYDPDAHAFGFIDPHEVIRAAYIMPTFAHGTTSDRLGPSTLARQGHESDKDYEYYYVGIFADRDMFMRHLGGGIGHHGAGVSLAQSREHARRRERTTTPDDLSDVDEEPENRAPPSDDGADENPDDAAMPDPEGEDEDGPAADGAEDFEGADDAWHFDAGFGGLVDDGDRAQLDEPAEDNDGYYDDDGALLDPYAMDDFAPL